MSTKMEQTAKDQAAFEMVKVGDIFSSSWGYDQTNVDFYEVIEKTKARVKVVGISKRTVDDNGGPVTHVVPVPGTKSHNERKAKAVIKKITDCGWGDEVKPCFTVSTYAYASLWDGEPEYQTGGGWGH